MSASLPYEQWLAHIRKHSTFYNTQTSHLPLGECDLEQLPIVNVDEYWRGSHDLDNWRVLTDKVKDALIFKTGGTTSQGKLSVYTHAEWQLMLDCFGHSLSAQLVAGDRIANLFFSGDLYASFLFIHGALCRVEIAITEFPFTGSVDLAPLADAVTQHTINVLAGVPAHLLAFASHINERGRTLPQITTVLFGGENLFESQLPTLKRAFPSARFASIGYASVDAGLVGASTLDCGLGEHRVFDELTRVEIIDDLSGEVIQACGRTGNLVVTNLTRTLMPIIRYPVGDQASWCEPAGSPQRKFALQGRSTESRRVRVGVVSLFPEEISEIIQRTAGSLHWQLVIEHIRGHDRLLLRWVADVEAKVSQTNSDALKAALIEQYPGLVQLSLDIQACNAREMERHPRSGKHLTIIDRRAYGPLTAGDLA
ncbi:phenylacetate--CoA ligase family protein [Pseudomonas sp. SWRI92]|uniref:Phenylacetate--CoA ligase family protein n=1 Tax=Pseudomonas marvdashtae TaxID=2745500 RepID=A0A923FMH0_9PSED|nr:MULTISPECIES: AMP-binding protein [Pseudomonas]MBC3372548.1 phenylacetate--CoA ligase family protein [Pseudomonas sp. SWRI92]MBV4551750.1 phenylacetate--CoA ligase family protein [Pseudomonas marvdashtae]